MTNLRIFLFVAAAMLLFPVDGVTQQKPEVKKQIEEYFNQSDRYKAIGLYGESMVELNNVIHLAIENGYREKLIKASIIKGELFRKTENFDRGILLLEQLKNTEEFPRLHVQKLGRLAALYAENAAIPRETARGVVEKLIEEALDISVRLDLREEEAGLRNEIGFAQNRAREFDLAMKNTTRAIELYEEVGDWQNKMGAQINLLDLFIGMGEFQRSDSLYPILVERIDTTEWYSMQSKLYGVIGNRYKGVGDTLTGLSWIDRAHAATVHQKLLNNSRQMAAFKVVHDTERFREEALQKTVDLERERAKMQRLWTFVVLLFVIIVAVVLVYFREKRLKRKLNTTVRDLNHMNDKYEMLIVESNHRIKNNLQMIISMLEFTKKGMRNTNTDIVQSMSGKIQTISALHKHLFVDVHNEFVQLDTYFEEIISHYKDIGLQQQVRQSISPVSLRSERIVYFGLILNEMLSNTLEHSKTDAILIVVEEKGDDFKFIYSDSSSHDHGNRQGTGTKLIQQLARRIKGRNYSVEKESGTYEFEFSPL